MDKVRDIAIVEQKALELRKRLGKTQGEFGKLIGISKTYVSDMENGYNIYKIKHVNNICNVADVTFDYMLGFSKEINKDVVKVKKIDLNITGKNLKAIRKELEFTQEKLSDKLSISQATISNYEKGKQAITMNDLKQICELSGYSADWCVGKLKKCIKYPVVKKIKAKDLKA